jgi:hypothetical protein
MPILIVSFAGGNQGAWRIRSVSAVVGTLLPTVEHLEVLEGAWGPLPAALPGHFMGWSATSGTSRGESTMNSLPVHRASVDPKATRAALIPIRKSEAWWTLPQDERRAIFEERSRHMATGLEYLPAVARRLHHSRDLGEPFDFLTWFEFAPIRLGSTNWSRCCERRRSGPISTARSISAWSGRSTHWSPPEIRRMPGSSHR